MPRSVLHRTVLAVKLVSVLLQATLSSVACRASQLVAEDIRDWTL